MRLTNEQRFFLDAMRLLIKLDNQIRALKGDARYSKQVIDLLAEIFELTIPNFNPSVYIEDPPQFCFSSSARIAISDQDWISFIGLMDGLRDEIIKNSLSENFDVGTVSITRKIYKDKGKPIKNPKPGKIYPKTKYRIVRQSHSNLHYVLSGLPDIMETFTVKIDSSSALFKKYFSADSRRAKNYAVTTSAFLGTISFHGVLQYILAKFYVCLGSFDRLKVCRYCQKLLVEEKSQRGYFCDSACRSKFHGEAERQDVKKCRARQNQWLKEKHSGNQELLKISAEIFTVRKYDCAGCRRPVAKRRRCPIIKGKNELIFDYLESQ